jgi:hypothetical protein
MSIKVGDVDLAAEIVELHFQLHRTQLLLDIVIRKVSGFPMTDAEVRSQIGGRDAVQAMRPILTASEVHSVDEETLRWLQNKFPKMGIKKSQSQ